MGHRRTREQCFFPISKRHTSYKLTLYNLWVMQRSVNAIRKPKTRVAAVIGNYYGFLIRSRAVTNSETRMLRQEGIWLLSFSHT
jgi:hypothetical protein